MINISGKQLIPAAIHYVTRLASSVNQVKSACPAARCEHAGRFAAPRERASQRYEAKPREIAERYRSRRLHSGPGARAAAYHTQIVADMRILRESADALETVIDKDLWPLPSYGDMLFEVSEP